MKKISAHLHKTLGFTLIELLIVIAVLGILAVAVLSAINPIEQMNRSRDTGSRSDAEQLIGAIDRYYTSKGYYPWQTGPTDGRAAQMNSFINTKDASQFNDGTANFVLNLLSEGETSEVKSSFVNRMISPNYNTLYIYNRGNLGDSTYVCFVPQSSAFNDDANKRCNSGMPMDFDAEANVCAVAAQGGKSLSCLP